jgi:hypothetical protein
MKIALPRAISPLGTRVTRASNMALGKELFAGPAVPRALCQQHIVCREQRALYREEAPLGRARDSGSVPKNTIFVNSAPRQTRHRNKTHNQNCIFFVDQTVLEFNISFTW